jgi:phospholipase C
MTPFAIDGADCSVPPSEAIQSDKDQTTAIDGGKMDGFSQIPGCTRTAGYACYSQFQPSQIPNLAALAQSYVVSDRTFEDTPDPSWGSHLQVATAQLDGFTGDNPLNATATTQQGLSWGCDAFRDAPWVAPGGTSPMLVPACIPTPDGYGPYRPSPVQWIPSIMDRLDQAGISWKIYQGANGWAFCPQLASCFFGTDNTNVLSSSSFAGAASAGTLPNISFLIPPPAQSQHNLQSMQLGDNWIGAALNAIMSGPGWNSTAIFITYDDCGCFYDHVPPPPGMGIRVPMVIVSPYAKPGFTDSTTASFNSMLAFIEHTFNLTPLASGDATAYDYSNSFNLTAPATTTKVRLASRPIPARERTVLRRHPAPSDASGT